MLCFVFRTNMSLSLVRLKHSLDNLPSEHNIPAVHRSKLVVIPKSKYELALLFAMVTVSVREREAWFESMQGRLTIYGEKPIGARTRATATAKVSG